MHASRVDDRRHPCGSHWTKRAAKAQVARLARCAVLIALSGCGSVESELPTRTLSTDGGDRAYRWFAPTIPHEGPRPLLVAVHGGGGRDEAFPDEEALHLLADAEGFHVVYPLSEMRPGNEGEWQLNTAATSRHDIDFVEALIDEVVSIADLDPLRIYATGYSLGSMFVYELACHSARFAAVASFAGTMPVEPASCDGVVPVMHVHSTDDSIIPYAQSWEWKAWDSVGAMRDVPGLVAFWGEQNGCQTSRESETSTGVHIVRDECDVGARVEHHRTATDHAWPETLAGQPMHEALWGFLSGFTSEGE